MKPLKAPSGYVFRRFFVLVCCTLCAVLAAAQTTPKVTLDNNPTLFTVLSAMNACGYDEDLDESPVLRTQVRNEIATAIAQNPSGQETLARWCRFYMDHQQPDAGKQLSQYISLALNLSDPPDLAPKIRESDLPPDSVYVLGAVPLLRNLYNAAGMGNIWQKHQTDYEKLVGTYHKQVADLLFNTDIYLKLQMSSYVGRSFIIYIDAMNPPGQVNSRNYGDDYYLVVAPGPNGLKLDQIRHTYLHYILDPLALKRANTIARMAPILKTVEAAPLDQHYKNEISLLVTESVIRAIEARTKGGEKGPEAAKQSEANHAMQEGFVLTQYFYEQLVKFEKEPTGLKDAFGEWLYNLYLPKEIKRAQEVSWTKETSPELLHRGSGRQENLMDQAERQLGAGNVLGAEKLARESMDANQDVGRALFLLARAATQRGDMNGAKEYFERTLQTSKDAKVLAWCHIYLGRISDITEDRQDALKHYMAALNTPEITPDTKAAAERGIKEPFQPPKRN